MRRRLLLAGAALAVSVATAQAAQVSHVIVDRTIVCHDPRYVAQVNDPAARAREGDVNYFADLASGGCSEIDRDEVFVLMGGLSDDELRARTKMGVAEGWYYAVGGPTWFVLRSAIQIDGEWKP